MLSDGERGLLCGESDLWTKSSFVLFHGLYCCWGKLVANVVSLLWEILFPFAMHPPVRVHRCMASDANWVACSFNLSGWHSHTGRISVSLEIRDRKPQVTMIHGYDGIPIQAKQETERIMSTNSAPTSPCITSN